MLKMSRRAYNMAASKTMVFTAKAAELKRQGISIMDFTAGEPDFPTPENIAEAGRAAIDAGYTKYTVVNGILPLREAICKKLEKENGVHYTPDQICVGTGAKQPLFNAVFAICEEGDEVIIPTPCWVSYEEMVKLAGAAPVFVPCLEEEGFGLDMEALRAAVTDLTKAVLICTPNNPTGAVYSRESLAELGALAVEKDFYIISDEVYENLVYEDAVHWTVASFSEEIKRHCVVINGLSKSYAMTGWRAGFAAAEDDVIRAIKGIQSHTTSASCSITQHAALEAYLGPQESISVMRAEFYRRREYMAERLSKMPHVSLRKSPGAFYIMLNVSGLLGMKFEDTVIASTTVLAELILEKAHVGLMAGDAFRAPHHLRICYAASMEDIVEGMDRLEAFLNRVQ